jgi:FMN phosphatase YigB (HAD superfamily)
MISSGARSQPQVFKRRLDRYGVRAARSVFIDDTEEFVAGARETGMHGIRYDRAVDLQQRLRELGLQLDWHQSDT